MPPRKSSRRVAIFNPDHLLEQADKLIAPQAGRPRQADIRRAISSAYYAIFHAIITKAVDQFVGATNRDKSHYGLVYRSVSHSRLRDLCNEVQKPTLPNKYRPYVPSTGLGPHIVAVAEAFVDLQENRHSADYDVMIRMNRSDAAAAIATARSAIGRFEKANQLEQQAFLSLLLFSPR
jgi:uncharacterized protein (UPF0332 family)